MRWILTVFLIIAPAFAATAQDDKGRITLYLEEALSDLGREVLIEGFSGALSSRATMKKLSIADADGVWLTLNDVVLDWNRAAVLGGRIEIRQLSAAKIDLPRLPSSSGTVSPEAGTFALPELPVSVSIDSIKADQVILGQPVIGLDASVSVSGALSLSGGQGAANLVIKRLDGLPGVFKLETSFSNASQDLAIDLELDEASNGLLANILNIPDRPALELLIKGTAPLDAFVAEVALKSEGQVRLAGRIGTQIQVPKEGSEVIDVAAVRLIGIDIAGDMTPLFAPQYRSFFGPNVALKSRISLFEDGRASLDELTVTTAALRLAGEVRLSVARLPERFRLDAELKSEAGGLVRLPMSGPETLVRSAAFTAHFDRQLGDAWSLTGDLRDVQRPEGKMDRLQLTADGKIQSGEPRQVTARVDASAQGITATDPNLAEVLGSAVSLGANILWHQGQTLDVSDLELVAKGMELTGAGKVAGLDSDLSVQGAVQAEVTDLSQLSGITGYPLQGSVKADLSGQAALLTGAFDLELSGLASDLGVGIESVDASISGESRLAIAAARNADGLTLRNSSVVANGGEVEASGQLASNNSDLKFKATLKDAGLFLEGLNGPAQLAGRALEDAGGWRVTLDAKAPQEFSGTAKVSLPRNGQPNVEIDARIGSVSWIVPELDGPGHLQGTARLFDRQWMVDATADGPGGSTLVLAGEIARDAATAALSLDGNMPLALLNRRLSPNSMQGLAQFDLRLDGPITLSSLNGQATTRGARLALPGLRNALTQIDATISLANNQAVFSTSSTFATDGQLLAQGRVGLQSPFATEAAVELVNVKVTDPQLYETSVNGDLLLSGSVPSKLSLAGRLALGRTEILVPSTGLGSFGEIPDITHTNEPVDVRRTRSKAGVLDVTGSAANGGGIAVGLNVQIVAENRIFIRGRGLDAELGGQLRLTGTTENSIPAGQFELIRGRLDILGQRLTLQEGSAQLQGGLIPRLRLVARTTSDDIVIFVIVEGPADAPEIRFMSEPELPSDEVLARLLFGRGVNSISAIQAVQLASAVATLAGRGGIGIVERLRQNAGFDNLDVTSDGEGSASLRLGKYISENTYTDVVIDSDGQSRINLNLDLTSSTKLRGQAGTDGNTGIGLFFERDY